MDGGGVRGGGNGLTVVGQIPPLVDADNHPADLEHNQSRNAYGLQKVARWVLILGSIGSQAGANPFVPACELPDRELVWSEPSLFSNFLYGSAERFTLTLEGKIVATGDARDEKVLTPQALDQLVSSTFAETTPIESAFVNGALVDYTDVIEGGLNVTYLRVIIQDKIIGFGFFSAHEKINVDGGGGRVATFYYVDRADHNMKDMRIEYSIAASSACIVTDGIQVILDKAEVGE